mmetsp:Transcript_25930/g.59008  ORF Transcript_25930/g.59008 Transcript_25930/m.59008 type:complete len:203 (-) Transcript_25930:14-622(-)
MQDNLVVDVSDVHLVEHGVPKVVFQDSSQNVESQGRTRMAHVRDIVNGGAANVHADLLPIPWDEQVLVICQRIVEPQPRVTNGVGLRRRLVPLRVPIFGNWIAHGWRRRELLCCCRIRRGWSGSFGCHLGSHWCTQIPASQTTVGPGLQHPEVRPPPVDVREPRGVGGAKLGEGVKIVRAGSKSRDVRCSAQTRVQLHQHSL